MLLEKDSNLVHVSCDLAVSENCLGQWKEKDTRNYYNVCLPCSRSTNKISRYKSFEENYFENIDTEEKAYILGLVTNTNGNNVEIYVPINLADRLRQVIGKECDFIFKGNEHYLVIKSKKCVEDINKAHELREEFKWAFLRGLFDVKGVIFDNSCTLNDKRAIEICKDADCVNEYGVTWKDIKALDFLGKLYEKAFIYSVRNYDLYLDFCSSLDCYFRWARDREDAVAPFKVNVSDSGYDLTLLEKIKTFGVVELYETGIKVQPNKGWYFDIVPRSSIIKSGYILANSVGVIDASYRGTIKVPLIKIDPEAPDLPLPVRLVQIIPRPIIHVHLNEVKDLDDTTRGVGGFGSTGVK